MSRRQTLDRQRSANILGAFALAVTDKMSAAIHAAGEISDMTSAAIIQIGFEPGLSIERLRMCLGLSHSATVRLVDAIVAAGLVVRKRNTAIDSRVAVLTLTAAGKSQMRKTLAARATVTEPVLARLSPEEAATLTRLLEKVMPSVVEPGPDEDIVCRLCDLDACPQDICPVCADVRPPHT